MSTPPRYIAFGPSSNNFIAHKGWSISSTEENKGLGAATDSMKLAKAIPYCCAFGENGSWILVYKDPRDGNSRYQSDDSFKYHYPRLSAWLKTLPYFDASNLWIALGPNGSFFAWTKGQTPITFRPPVKLEDRLKLPWSGVPRVALGMDDTYMFWTDRGDFNYSLTGKLVDWLKIKVEDGVKVEMASLSSFQEGVYFVLLSNGAATWTVPESQLSQVQKIVTDFRSGSGGVPKLVSGGTDIM